MLTEITIQLDQVTLQTVKMGLALLQLQAQATDAFLNAQVQAALTAANPVVATNPQVDPV